MATWKARETSSGSARRIVDLGDPFGERAEHRAVVDLLERLALAHAARDLADEQDHRRRILLGDVDAGEALVAPGPRVTKQMPGRPVSLPCGLRHHGRAALLPADGDGDVGVVQRVEHREKAFARHAEQVLDAVDDQLVDQDLAAGARMSCHQFFRHSGADRRSDAPRQYGIKRRRKSAQPLRSDGVGENLHGKERHGEHLERMPPDEGEQRAERRRAAAS